MDNEVFTRAVVVLERFHEEITRLCKEYPDAPINFCDDILYQYTPKLIRRFRKLQKKRFRFSYYDRMFYFMAQVLVERDIKDNG